MLLILISTVLLVIFAYLFRSSQRPSNFPPGPKWLPIVGNIPLVTKQLSKFGFHHLVWADMVTTYGNIVGLKLGMQKVVLVADKDLIKEVSMRQEFEGRPDGFFWRLRSRKGRLGVVFSDGPIWAEQRRFSIQHLKKLGLGRSKMEELIADEAAALVAWLKPKCGTPVNMDNFFDISVINVLWALIAGKRYPKGDETMTKVCNAIHESFRLLDSSGGLLQQIPIIRYVAPELSGYNAVVANHQTLWMFLNKTIEEHKKSIQPGIDRDFIDAYLHKMYSNVDSSYTDDQLYVVCLDFLQAGTDTTSNTIAFFILYMINYPEVQKKIQNEIDIVIGKNRKPMLEDRSRMPYLTAVIHEVQRIATVAPVGVPHRVCRTTTLSGYEIPEDTTVLMLVYNQHMNVHWKDPHNFRPDRFLDEHNQLISDDWFNPFGYGKRKCIGENLAKSNIFLFCAFIFQTFNAAKEDGSTEPLIEISNGITLTPKPFNVIWTNRT